MSAPNNSLAKIRTAYEFFIDTVTDSIAFRRDDEHGSPIDLDLLLFSPPPEDNLSGDEFFTYIGTAGMSAQQSKDPNSLVEIVMCVTGEQSQADLKQVARALAQFAIRQCSNKVQLTPNQISSEMDLPLFEGRNRLMLSDFATNSPEWLPGLDPPVRLLYARAVFPKEADVITKIGDIEAARRFRSVGVNLDSPDRSEVDLSSIN